MNWFDKIDDYYHNRLTVEESNAFEKALEKDDSLRQKLEEIGQRERDEYVKGIWRRLVEEDEQKRQKKCVRRCKLVALGFLIFTICFGLWLFSKE